MRVSFIVQKFLSLVRCHLLMFFVPVLSASCSECRSCANEFKTTPDFLFYQTEIILVLCFRSLMYFKLSFVQMVDTDLFLFFCMQLSHMTSTICWRCCIFSRVYFWLLWEKKKSVVCRCMELCLGLQFDSIHLLVCFYSNMLFLLL